MKTGVKPIDLMINGLRDGAFIQLAVDTEVPASTIAMQFFRNAQLPTYVDVGGMMDTVAADDIFGDKLILVDKNGEEAMDVLEYLIVQQGTDGIIVDSVPSIVSGKEMNGDGDELDTVMMLNRKLLRLRSRCMQTGIPIVWINHLKYSPGEIRVWGGKSVSQKMNITFACENRRAIYKNKSVVGLEVSLSVIISHHRFINRRTFFGVFKDHSIDYGYWLFKEAQRYQIVKRTSDGYVFDGTAYQDEWKLINEFQTNGKFSNKIRRMLADEEKRKGFYK